MFSLQHAGRPAHLPRVVFFIAMICVVLFVVTSCSNGTTTGGTSLIGTWKATQQDQYIITENHLTYIGYDADASFSGSIRHIAYFTANSGVIIIEYDPGHTQLYWDYEGWNKIGQNQIQDQDPFPPTENFLGIYFKSLTTESADFAGALDLNTHKGCEAATLDVAKTKFTLDNVDQFVYQFGGYARQ